MSSRFGDPWMDFEYALTIRVDRRRAEVKRERCILDACKLHSDRDFTKQEKRIQKSIEAIHKVETILYGEPITIF